MSHTPANPACPFCGERQSYDEARPSRPRVIVVGGKPQTEYFTECRTCGERIIWGFQYGSGRLEDLGAGAAQYSWGKP